MLSQRDHRGREIYVFRMGNNSDYRFNDVIDRFCVILIENTKIIKHAVTKRLEICQVGV